MKNCLYLFGILLCLLSCRENKVVYPHALLLMDSLSHTCSDSAIFALERMETQMQSESQDVRKRYYLLCVKMREKTNERATSDSLILKLLDCYAEEDETETLAEVYYHAGRVYKELGDAPKALSYYTKALEIFDDTSLNNPNLQGLIHSQIGRLFFERGALSEAKEERLTAYSFSSLEKDTLGMVYDLRDVASVYVSMNVLDSALIYYRKAYSLATALQNRREQNITQGQMVRILERMGEDRTALNLLSPILNEVDSTMQSEIYLLASILYQKVDEPDSVSHYTHKLLERGSVYAKTNAYWLLSDIALERENLSDARKYLRGYMQGMDSVWNLNKSEALHKARSLYNYTFREKENYRLKLENERKNFYLSLSVLGILLLLLCLVVYWLYGKKKQMQTRLRVLQLEQLRDAQKRKTLEYVEKNKVLQEELRAKAEEAVANTVLLERLKREKELLYYAGKHAEVEVENKKEARSALLKSEILCFFREQCTQEKNMIISADKWVTLEKAVNEAYDDFMNKLLLIHKMSEYEKQLCLLIKVEFSPKEMSRLTNHSKESIASTRRRLYEKFFGSKGTPQQWDQFIVSL